MTRIPVGLALYSVRDQLARDYEGTLRKVADIGYAGVELSAAAGAVPSAEVMRDLLADTGLRVAGNEVGLAVWQNERDAFIAYQQVIGNRHLGVSAIPPDMRNPAGYHQAAAFMNELGADLKREDMILYYHNHAFEFEVVEGVRGLDIIYGETDPDLVKLLPDLYWVTLAGEDPAVLIRAHAGRVFAVHLKDMRVCGEQRTSAEVGEGVIDWEPIFEACEEQGVDWYIVEHDLGARPSLESARISFENLSKWGKV